jgi:hypothetical protein
LPNTAAENRAGIVRWQMNYSYWRTERLILDAVDRRILQKVSLRGRIISLITNGDFVALAIFCIIGLLVGLAVMVAVPGFAELTEPLQQFL